MAGYTFSADFPVVNPVQPAPGGNYDAFAVRVNAAGSGIIFGTLLGGLASDSANAVAVDTANTVYVAGQTSSYNFPLQGPIQNVLTGAYNGFALKAPTLPSRSGTLTAAPNPIQVCDGSGLGVTTLSWSASGVSTVSLRVNSPSGAAFSPSSPPSGSATTGKWIGDGTVLYLQDISGGLPLTSANTLASVTVHVTNAACGGSRSGTLTAAPNPIQVCDGSGLGVTTLSWSASGVSTVSLRVNSPSGAAFSPSSPPSGSATTGKWIGDGTVLYLQDISGGLPLTSANTLASVTVHVTNAACGGSRSGTLTAAPNPIQVCDGSGLGVTTLSWSASGVSTVSLRVNSPSGAAFSPSSPPSGSATTGKWIGDGTVLYLQDISGGLPLTSANTLASVTVPVTTAGCQSSP